jgi:hypothetical protein
MRTSRINIRAFFRRSVKLVPALAISVFAISAPIRADESDDLVKYSFSRDFNAGADLNRMKESHLVATDAQGHIESHPVRFSEVNGSVIVEADFVSRRGLTNAIVWLISESGEEWNLVGSLEVEKGAPPTEAQIPQAVTVETKTPTPTITPAESSECTSQSYDAFILANEVASIKASLSALAVEDPLQAALQAREAELSELLRSIAENESPTSVSGPERSAPAPGGNAGASGASGGEVPLGVQKKELEKLKEDREALEDELAAWGVM